MAALSAQLSQLSSQLAAARPASSQLVGWLYKWEDREISMWWGGSRWSPRYFKLEGPTLSYYGKPDDAAPRRSFDLRHCALLDEGEKGSRREGGLTFRRFGLYLEVGDRCTIHS